MERMNLNYKKDNQKIKKTRYLNKDNTQAKVLKIFLGQIDEFYGKYHFSYRTSNENENDDLNYHVIGSRNPNSTVANDIKDNIKTIQDLLWEKHCTTVKKANKTRKKHLKNKDKGKSSNNGKHNATTDNNVNSETVQQSNSN